MVHKVGDLLTRLHVGQYVNLHGDVYPGFITHHVQFLEMHTRKVIKMFFTKFVFFVIVPLRTRYVST